MGYLGGGSSVMGKVVRTPAQMELVPRLVGCVWSAGGKTENLMINK